MPFITPHNCKHYEEGLCIIDEFPEKCLACLFCPLVHGPYPITYFESKPKPIFG